MDATRGRALAAASAPGPGPLTMARFRGAGDRGLGGIGRRRTYGKIRHEDTSNAVRPIRKTVDTAATVT